MARQMFLGNTKAGDEGDKPSLIRQLIPFRYAAFKHGGSVSLQRLVGFIRLAILHYFV